MIPRNNPNPYVKIDDDQFDQLIAALSQMQTKIQNIQDAIADLPGREANINLTGELDGAPVEFVGAYDINNT